MKRLLPTILLLLAVLSAAAQDNAYKEYSDTLTVLLERHSGIPRNPLELKKVLKRQRQVDLYFSSTLGNTPWREQDISWFRCKAQNLLPSVWEGYRVGEIFAGRVNLNDLTTRRPGTDGKPNKIRNPFRKKDQRGGNMVRRNGAAYFEKGLSGRHIAVWQSHGRYFNESRGYWDWQRATLFGTVEDMYTQSYVLPFLIPMLENAGAYVLTPRERDLNRFEAVCDNDPSFSIRGDGVRAAGLYEEKGKWRNGGQGFADSCAVLELGCNPFAAGSFRETEVVPSDKSQATARWEATVPARGSYAVYVSYVTTSSSSSCARYRVKHNGGTSEFIVDQRKGGSTWIYLGSFDFDGRAEVTLDNGTPKGCRYIAGATVSADAVRIGGGMGKVGRSSDGSDLQTSGMPSFAEGALYSMVWSGTGSCADKWDNDYTRDFASRGAWVEKLRKERGIPFDLSLAFHTDAGIRDLDSLVGTLAIYSSSCDGSRNFPDGSSRQCSRLLADYVQTQVCEDNGLARRYIWDKGYSESRTCGVPALLLELLSHQNFNDMKRGLDPAFRFNVCRSVYKGILKFLADYYGCEYAVQPLPVHKFSALLKGNSAVLSWAPTEDPLEPTAVAKRYVVYTRVDGGAWDDGFRTSSKSCTLKIAEGHIYSYKVVAEGDGGSSFPSETLSLGIPKGSTGSSNVLVVNGFCRVGAPAYHDSDTHAGFDYAEDSGVQYGNGICYIGPQYEFNRLSSYVCDSYPGFGACSDEYAGNIQAGNSFDYPYIHGKALMRAGYRFCSCGRDSYEQEHFSCSGLDLICGKQRDSVFTAAMKSAVEEHLRNGGKMVVSGAYIASDPSADGWTEKVLGYRMQDSHAGRDGKVLLPDSSPFGEFRTSPNPEIYSVENADALQGNAGFRTILRYAQRHESAAVSDGRIAAFGFPLETLGDEERLSEIFKGIF